MFKNIVNTKYVYPNLLINSQTVYFILLFFEKNDLRKNRNSSVITLISKERKILMNLTNRFIAEFIDTFWLVLVGCDSAVLAASFPELCIGFVCVALAFGLTVLTMAYAIGHISGCHLNPAVTVGLFVGGRFPGKDIAPYIVSQLLGNSTVMAVLGSADCWSYSGWHRISCGW